MPRLTILSTTPAGSPAPAGRSFELEPGQEVTVGRDPADPHTVEIDDDGISRRALTVTADRFGWHLVIHNANGAIIAPWGQPQRWAEIDQDVRSRWPRIGVRLIGSHRETHHWVLLTSEPFEDSPTRPQPAGPRTSLASTPGPLTPAQLEALRVVFDDYLRWPPVASPTPLPLQAAARRLGVSTSAVFQRLDAARERAAALGSSATSGVSDPTFVYTLVSAGYLGPAGS